MKVTILIPKRVSLNMIMQQFVKNKMIQVKYEFEIFFNPTGCIVINFIEFVN